eukprot:263618-Prymnesium_polylepis.1
MVPKVRWSTHTRGSGGGGRLQGLRGTGVVAAGAARSRWWWSEAHASRRPQCQSVPISGQSVPISGQPVPISGQSARGAVCNAHAAWRGALGWQVGADSLDSEFLKKMAVNNKTVRALDMKSRPPPHPQSQSPLTSPLTHHPSPLVTSPLSPRPSHLAPPTSPLPPRPLAPPRHPQG